MGISDYSKKRTAYRLILAVILWVVFAGHTSALAQPLHGTAAVQEVVLLRMAVDAPRAKPAVYDVHVRFDTDQTPDGTANMNLTIYCECGNTNHVGNEWSYGFCLNDEPVTSGSRIAVNADAGIAIPAWIEEEDKYSDYGDALDTIGVTLENLQSGFSFTQTMRVTEDGGRYKGNTAVWEVTYIFMPQE